MITIKCVETGDVYLLSGDDETINVKLYNDIAASLAGLMRDDTFLKMHKNDIEHRIAIAKLTGFNYVFHAHERAVKLNQISKHATHVSHSLLRLGSVFYEDYERSRNARRLQNTFKYTGTP